VYQAVNSTCTSWDLTHQTKMNVIYSIRVYKGNINVLKTLKCFESVSMSGDGDIICQFKPNKTRGNLIARSGDWVVEYSTGEYQRYGSEAYNRLFRTPNAESNKEY
jgi:hypothetical protein